MLDQKGATLLELFVAIAFLVAVAVTISVSFSMATKHMMLNRQRWVATSLTNTQIQTLKSQPYSYLETTDHTYPPALYPLIFTAANPTCDCTKVDFSTLTPTITTVSGMNFKLASCVNLVQPGTLASQCETGPDTGYKQIVVHTWWSLGASSATITQESLLTRF